MKKLTRKKRSKNINHQQIPKRILLISGFCITIGIVSVVISIFVLFASLHLNPELVWQGLTSAVLKQTNSRTNILLFAVEDGVHGNPDVTDTMVIVSVPHKSGQIAFISVPKDIWSDTLQNNINQAYKLGKEKSSGRDGLLFSKQIATEVTGLPIHYTVLLNVDGFRKFVDLLGGIDVGIPEEFSETCITESSLNCLRQSNMFLPGIEHLYGEQALEYLHHLDTKGEQQILFEAIYQRLLHPSTYLTNLFLKKSISLLSQYVKTDISESMMISLVVHAAVHLPFIPIAVNSLLVQPPEELYDGKSVLIPKGSWTEFYTALSASLSGTIK